MVKKQYNLISQDLDKLLEMLSLRRDGWTFVFLAELFDCDRTSLRYQCRKYQIFPIKKVFTKNSKEVFNPKRISHNILIEINPIEPSQWVDVDGERVNTGKSYSDYLKTISPYKTY